MRFCLTGGWFDSPNVGDNALLLGIVESLGKAAPAEFTVLTPDPVRVQALHGLSALAPRRHPITLIRLLYSVDALVFTGGIGENAAALRRAVLQGAAWLGVHALPDGTPAVPGPLTEPGSPVAAWVLRTDEEGVIARHTAALAWPGLLS